MGLHKVIIRFPLLFKFPFHIDFALNLLDVCQNQGNIFHYFEFVFFRYVYLFLENLFTA